MNEAQLAAFAQIVSAAITATQPFNLGNPAFRDELKKLMEDVTEAVTNDPYGP